MKELFLTCLDNLLVSVKKKEQCFSTHRFLDVYPWIFKPASLSALCLLLVA